MKITFDEMWERIKKYLSVDKALEEGFSNGKYTAVLAKYAKNVDAIDKVIVSSSKYDNPVVSMIVYKDTASMLEIIERIFCV